MDNIFSVVPVKEGEFNELLENGFDSEGWCHFSNVKEWSIKIILVNCKYFVIFLFLPSFLSKNINFENFLIFTYNPIPPFWSLMSRLIHRNIR